MLLKPQSRSQLTGSGKRCCQPATAVPPAATGVGMRVTNRCPPHRPPLCPTTPTRTSCSHPRVMMSARMSPRARTSCLRTPYLESERYTILKQYKSRRKYLIYTLNHNHLTQFAPKLLAKNPTPQLYTLESKAGSQSVVENIS